jgi:hypothetical protein
MAMDGAASTAPSNTASACAARAAVIAAIGGIHLDLALSPEDSPNLGRTSNEQPAPTHNQPLIATHSTPRRIAANRSTSTCRDAAHGHGAT